jgi:hypothetical protein
MKRFRNEEGVALVTALVVAAIVSLIGFMVVSLGIHNIDQSANDRDRILAVNAAESGLDTVEQTIQTTPTASLPCTSDGDLATSPVAHYHVVPTYYGTYPISGSPLTCPLVTRPAGAVLASTGTVGPRSLAQTMQAEMRLSPIYGAWGQAIFSDTALSLNNSLTLNGYTGNDAPVYTNGNWSCGNASILHGSVSLPNGAATLSQSCNVSVDVSATNAISIANTAVVGHNATSVSSSITMTGGNIYKDAIAGTTCTGCSGRVSGTITTNYASPPLASYAFPAFNYDQSAWQAAGYTTTTYSNCTNAKNFIADVGSATSYVVRITPSCALALSGTVTVRANLAIISDGPISTANNTSFTSADGQPHHVFFMVPAGSNCTGVNAANISFANLNTFINVSLFVYSPCTVTFNNNNNGLGGQIYGGTVNISNAFQDNFIPIDVPGLQGAVAGYNEDIAFIREIPNP